MPYYSVDFNRNFYSMHQICVHIDNVCGLNETLVYKKKVDSFLCSLRSNRCRKYSMESSLLFVAINEAKWNALLLFDFVLSNLLNFCIQFKMVRTQNVFLIGLEQCPIWRSQFTCLQRKKACASSNHID